MNIQLSKVFIAPINTLVIAAALLLAAATVQAEPLLLFTRTAPEWSPTSPIARPHQRAHRIKLDEKGDLLIQCAGARFTVAYNSPVDPLKPPEQPRSPQREENIPINGISVVASLAF